MKYSFSALMFFAGFIISCSGHTDEAKVDLSKEIEGYWRLDSTVEFKNNVRQESHDIVIIMRFDNNKIYSCNGSDETAVSYSVKDLGSGKGILTVNTDNDTRVSKIVLSGKELVLIQEEENGNIQKWYHSRLTKEHYNKVCKLKSQRNTRVRI